MAEPSVQRWSEPKDPADVVDYSLDWSKQLALAALPDTTIATVTWTVPTGLTQVDALKAGAVTSIWLSGGAPNADYLITCRITTAGGRTIERSAVLAVRDV